MNQPEAQQIEHWLKTFSFQIDNKWKLFNSGFYEEEDLPIQGMYTSLAMFHASLARSKFLNGDPLAEVRIEFANAAKSILKSFTMAYDKSDPDYVGDKCPPPNPHYTGHKDSIVEAKWLDPVYGQVSWSDVMETEFIEGVNYALMAGDFELTQQLAEWFRDPGDGDLMDIDVNRYAHALKHALLGGRQQGWGLLKVQLDDYAKKPPKSAGDKNYFTLITILFGILEKDMEKFNEGLAAQLKFYQGYVRGEGKDTTEEFICDHAVALTNLGLHHGFHITVEHDTLPKGLLIQV